ncbi:MAG: hypothetical protein KAU14_04125 [Thermoplasmata archaeon]|nr:hypothetical protein [Thermoplasmata archaeon]
MIDMTYLKKNPSEVKDDIIHKSELNISGDVVRLIEQHPVEADLLKEKIEELTDLLHSVTAMQEEERFLKDLGEACGAVERLLGGAVRIASEAEEIMEELK